MRTKRDRANIRIRLAHGRIIDAYATTDFNILTELWDNKNECLKFGAVTPKNFDKAGFEKCLYDLKCFIETQYQIDKDSRVIDSEWLQSVVNGQKDVGNFFAQLKTFYTEAKIVEGRRRHYKALEAKLRRFEQIYRLKLSLDTFSPNILQKFEKFIREEPILMNKYPDLYKKDGKRIKERGQNYINSVLKEFMSFINHSIKIGLTNNNPFNGYEFQPDEYADPVALTLDEMDAIYKADVPKSLEKVRDMFMLHCYIGARVSDFVSLKRDNVINGTLVYIASKGIKKSQNTVYVPLCANALAIIAKYEEPIRLFPFMNISGRNGYNARIKKLLQHLNINRKVLTINTLTGRQELMPLCDTASSHLARKSFVSAILNKTRSTIIASKFTGHSINSKAFARYPVVQEDTLKGIIDDTFK